MNRRPGQSFVEDAEGEHVDVTASAEDEEELSELDLESESEDESEDELEEELEEDGAGEEDEEDEEPDGTQTQQRNRGARRQPAEQSERTIAEIRQAIENDTGLRSGEMGRYRAHQQSVQARLQNARQKRSVADEAWTAAPQTLVTEITQSLQDQNVNVTDTVTRLITQTVNTRLQELGRVAGQAETVYLHDALDRILEGYSTDDARRQIEYGRMTLEEKMEEVARLRYEDGQANPTEASSRGQQRANNLNNNRQRVQAPPRAPRRNDTRARKTFAQLEEGYGSGTLSEAEEKRYLAQAQG